MYFLLKILPKIISVCKFANYYSVDSTGKLFSNNILLSPLRSAPNPRKIPGPAESRGRARGSILGAAPRVISWAVAGLDSAKRRGEPCCAFGFFSRRRAREGVDDRTLSVKI